MASSEQQKQAVKDLHDAYQDIPLIPLALWQGSYADDAPARGSVWIAKGFLAAPPDSRAVDAIIKAYSILKTSTQPALPRDAASAVDVKVEWLAARQRIDSPSDESRSSEHGNFLRLQQDIRCSTTILFVHGGAFYLQNAVSVRAVTTGIARRSGCRVASISHRLSPQHPFPAALVDLLVAYMALLHPTQESWHEPVAPQQIVLAADSSGANLCLALVQTILTLQRNGQYTLLHDGAERALPLPKGLALYGPPCDWTDSFPSFQRNASIDFLPYPQPPYRPDFPRDQIWPTNPPRGHVYCEPGMLAHPLVSPAASEDWSGAPPSWWALAEGERNIDGARHVAALMRCQGSQVDWEEYEGMCHGFGLMLRGLPQTHKLLDSWAAACVKLGEQGSPEKGEIRRVKMPDCQVSVHDSPDLQPFDVATVRQTMHQSANSKFPVWRGKPSDSDARVAKL